MMLDSTTPRRFAINKAAEQAVGLSPCKDCPDRYPGCGGACERYQTWKRNIAETKERYAAMDKGARDADMVLIEGQVKIRDTLRKKGRLKKRR